MWVNSGDLFDADILRNKYWSHVTSRHGYDELCEAAKERENSDFRDYLLQFIFVTVENNLLNRKDRDTECIHIPSVSFSVSFSVSELNDDCSEHHERQSHSASSVSTVISKRVSRSFSSAWLLLLFRTTS